MRKSIKALLLLAAMTITAGLFSAEEKLSKEELADQATREKIQKLFASSEKKAKKATMLYERAKARTDQLLADINEKEKALDEGIKEKSRAKGAKNIKALRTAKKMKADAAKMKKVGNLYGTVKALNLGLKAVGIKAKRIADISIKATPELFSPDGDNVNDVLNIDIDCKPRKIGAKEEKIAEYEVVIYKVETGSKGEEYIALKTFKGKGNPPKRIEWDGMLDDGKTKVDSASRYAVQAEVNNLEGQAKTLKAVFNTDVFVSKTERGKMIDISNIKFKSGSAKIGPEYEEVIKQVYTVIKKPEFKSYQIIVEGHSDFQGGASYNVRLSKKRAQSVADFLIKLGVEKERITARGCGEADPKTYWKDQKALNRRVAFYLLKNDADKKVYNDNFKKLKLTKNIRMKTRSLKKKK